MTGAQGPQGLTGVQGPQGLVGPQGPAGPDKELQTRTVEGQSEIIPLEPNYSLLTASCFPGEVATGGSYEVQEQFFTPEAQNLINYQVIEYGGPFVDSTRLTTQWEVRIQNSGPDPIRVTAFAVCAKLVDVP